MTTYRSLPDFDSDEPNPYRLITIGNKLKIVNSQGNGTYVRLTDDQAENLALELLGHRYSISRSDSFTIHAMKRRPVIKVGQFYRVESTDGMCPSFGGNPLVKVVSVESANDFVVQTASGSESTWTGLDGLSGPVAVTEQKVWTEA